MIATSKSHPPRRDSAVPAVPAADDPRRSYDRGVWTGSGPAPDVEGEPLGDTARGAPTDLASVSLDALRRELERRQKGLDALLAQRARLAQELAAVDAQLGALQDAGRSPRRPASARGEPARLALPRMKNSLSLPEAVALEAEVGQIVTAAEMAKRVLASGYQTSSKTFIGTVTNTLSNDARFRRVGRGRYERLGA